MLKYRTYNAPKIVRPDAVNIGQLLISEVDKQANSFDEFLMLPRDHESGLFERFYVNQLEYLLSEDGNIIVDRVLRFENLREEFDVLAQEIGLNGALPHANKTTFTQPKEKYYSDKSRIIIRQRFKKDFDYF